MATDLDNLNNRLYNSVKDLNDIQTEKRELERNPEENAPQIEKLKYLEEAKLDEIGQIREDKAALEPAMESSLGDKLHDFGQDMKDKAGEIGAAVKGKAGEMVNDFKTNVSNAFDDIKANFNNAKAAYKVGEILTDATLSALDPNYAANKIQEAINNPQAGIEEEYKTLNKVNSDQNKDYKEQGNTLQEGLKKEINTPSLNDENHKTPANDNTPPENSPDGDGKKKNKENDLSNENSGQTPANDNVKPANDNEKPPVDKADLATLLKDYNKDYNKEKFSSGSHDQAAEKATDNLVNKLESQREPSQENSSKGDITQSKEEKAKDLLKEQYGDIGKEGFEKIKEQEKEKDPQQLDKQNTQKQEQSR